MTKISIDEQYSRTYETYLCRYYQQIYYESYYCYRLLERNFNKIFIMIEKDPKIFKNSLIC